MALAAPVPTPAPVPTRARLETLAVHEGASPAVELGLSRTVTPTVHRLANPPRVYIDLQDTALSPSVARSLDGAGVVAKVRLGQFDPATVRVVVELAAAIPVDVRPSGTTIRLVFGASAQDIPAVVEAPPRTLAPPPAPKVMAPIAPERARAAAPDPDPAPIDVPRLTAVRVDQPFTRPVIAAEEAAAPVMLQERVARRYAAEDWPGIVALYAGDTETIRRDANSATRAAVVDALRELGLTYSARKLLGPSSLTEAPVLRVARAEVALAGGDAAAAGSLVTGLDEASVDPVLVPKLRRVQVRLALARGDLEGAATRIGKRTTPELRAELAYTAIAAGRVASEQRACGRALVAFRQALDADGGRMARTAAGAGLVQAALVCDDAEATMAGLGVLAESPHPLLRRAAAAIATTQTDGERQAARTERQGG